MKKLLFSAVMFLLIACSNNNKIPLDTGENNATLKENMQEKKDAQNKQVALLCIKSWSRGNIDEIVKHLASNTMDLGDGSTPPAKGIDSVKFFMQLWNSSVKDYKSDNELAVADSDYVFVYAGWSGTFKNDFMGMKTTGKSFKFKDVDIFKFNDEGKITEHRAINFSTVLKQLASQPN
ncbi:MAG TPA: ester cyclase [Panacibacter sp.]|nr:ester cyclase [Panacibacter sp.]